jgi:hypothetical protein
MKLFLLWAACEGPAPETTTTTTTTGGAARADVVKVAVTGDAGAYTFAVTLRSDETGCDQYADWWEVLTSDGALVYRRILDHSHPTEQPFTRDGGPVTVEADQEVVVRAHLHPIGYRGDLLRGAVSSGFAPWEAPSGCASELAEQTPLPEACLF